MNAGFVRFPECRRASSRNINSLYQILNADSVTECISWTFLFETDISNLFLSLRLRYQSNITHIGCFNFQCFKTRQSLTSASFLIIFSQ
jgi:hypothetical protein